MEKQQVEEILACLTGERTVFHYVRDGYALELLRDYIGEGMAINDLRQSPFAQLLNKPLVKEAMAAAGGGKLKPVHLDYVLWRHEPLHFVLTLDQWGNGVKSDRQYNQLSRCGRHLVLQLNFANDHQQQYKRWVKNAEHAEFSYWSHPVVTEGKYETLAWARIDLDFAADQALIEEIQSDWVRQVKYSWNESCFENLPLYREQVLKPYTKVWNEAVLTAAIRLIRHDLGIGEVLYNSFDTGNLMKGIDADSAPPRSLYTDLPKRFGFVPVTEAPVFLRNERHLKRFRRQGKKLFWFRLPTSA